MKTAIVTFIRAYNFGAVLQCYALQRAMESVGIENEVLDYYPLCFYNDYRLAANRKWSLSRRLIRNLTRFLFFPLIYRRIRHFERFISANINLSMKQFRSNKEIENGRLDYSAYVAGSDQVWNGKLTDQDPVFFLACKGMNGKKFSYAASFGDSNVSGDLRDKYVQALSGWEGYSVREKSGAELLNQLIGVNAEVNCDPTLLLKSSDWLKLTGQRKHKKPYILVYNVKNAEFDRLLSLAEKINSEKEMDIVMIPSVMAGKQLLGLPARRRGYTYLSTIGPDDYLTYFHDAEYVISDSFHGTVFSLLFHKPFFVLSRFSDGSANARANELLKLVGIQENDGTIENLDREIDWLAVDHKIAEMRKQGLSYLSHIETQINL